MYIDRRAFLALGAAAVAQGQLPTAPMPAPPKAQITSSVMLWTLAGNFERRIRTAAEAGFQSVGLRDEYTQWDDGALLRAKRYIESFGMRAEMLFATPDWSRRPVSLTNSAERGAFLADLRRGITVAKKLEAPYVIMVSGNEAAGSSRQSQYESLLEGSKQAAALAAAADLTLLVAPMNNKLEHQNAYLTTCAEGVKVVKEVDSPYLRMMVSVYDEQVQTRSAGAALRDVLENTAVVQIADTPERSEPGTGSINLREIYRVLQKGGYTHTVAMEYMPKGDAIASLKRAVDQFRAVVNERGAPAVNPLAPTEGSFV